MHLIKIYLPKKGSPSGELKPHGAAMVVQRAILNDQRDRGVMSDVLVRMDGIGRREQYRTLLPWQLPSADQ